MRRFSSWLICAASSSIWPLALSAHHSFVSHYDPTRSVPLQGTVLNFTMLSPHSFLYLETTDASGQTRSWEIEMASIPLLRRQGFNPDTFRPGDQVSVNIWPNRDPEKSLVWGRGFVTAAGVALGEFPPTPAVDSAYLEAVGVDRLQGRWRAPVDASVGTSSPLPLTAAGRAAVQSYDPRESPANRCEPNSVPATYHHPYQFEIRIAADEAVIRNEMYSVTRTIRLGADAARSEPTGAFGVSVARIEGDELVIESAGFPASGWGLGTASDELGAGTDVPSSEGKDLVERFSVSDDGQRLTVHYTLEDPMYLTQPYAGEAVLDRVADDEPLYAYECELESARKFSRGR